MGKEGEGGTLKYNTNFSKLRFSLKGNRVIITLNVIEH